MLDNLKCWFFIRKKYIEWWFNLIYEIFCKLILFFFLYVIWFNILVYIIELFIVKIRNEVDCIDFNGLLFDDKYVYILYYGWFEVCIGMLEVY